MELAATRRPVGTRLGTLASRAGCQNSVRVSMRNETRNSMARLSTNTSERTRRALATSAVTIVNLRLNRSARTPDTAPNKPGSMRAERGTRIPATPPSSSASAIVANNATQSPKLEKTPAHHRRANEPRRTRLNGRVFSAAPFTIGENNTGQPCLRGWQSAVGPSDDALVWRTTPPASPIRARRLSQLAHFVRQGGEATSSGCLDFSDVRLVFLALCLSHLSLSSPL